MRLSHRLALTFALLTAANEALAQDAAPPPVTPAVEPEPAMKQPIAYVERPLTLPAMALSPQLDAAIARADFGGNASTAFQMELAGSFGITDDLMVEARPGGFIAGDVDFDYTRFQLGVTYRFLKDPVEIGARFRFQIDNSATLAFNPGLPVRIHAGKLVRIDTGVNFTGAVPTDGGDAVAALSGIATDFLKPAEAGIPLDVSFQIIDPVFVGLSTGYGILSFEEPADFSYMPLGFFAGGTVPGDEGPLADIGASFGFPFFLLGASNENPNTELWLIGLTVRGFLYL